MKKLIRDRLPEIINDNNCSYYIASNEEYAKRLEEKLLEEVNEFIKDKTIEELADILEVIDAICKFKNFKKDNLYKVKENKFLERGGFSKKIILVKP